MQHAVSKHINNVLKGESQTTEVALEENQLADGERRWKVIKAGFRYQSIDQTGGAGNKKERSGKNGKILEQKKAHDERVEKERLYKQARDVLEIEFHNLQMPKFEDCIDELCLRVYVLTIPAKDF